VFLANPERVKIDRMPFSAKLDLAQALGALNAEDTQPLRALNTIRNRLAHDLHKSVGPDDVRSLEQSLAGRFAAFYAKVGSEGEAPKRLETWFTVVLMALEYVNMHHEYEVANASAIGVYRLVSAMEEEMGGKRTPPEELMRKHGVPPLPDPRDAWINYAGRAKSGS
jgi:hypothetical protein